jgi:hypothetical protein
MPENDNHFKFKSVFYGRAKLIAIISIVFIISISYGLFFSFKTLQNLHSNNSGHLSNLLIESVCFCHQLTIIDKMHSIWF